MPKKPGTILREYTEEYFVHMRNLAAEVEIFDGRQANNKLSPIDYMVTITWYAGTLIIEATKDNKLTISATEKADKGLFFNAFTVTTYYVMKDTIKAVWDSLQYAVYSADISIETIYNNIEQAAKQVALS